MTRFSFAFLCFSVLYSSHNLFAQATVKPNDSEKLLVQTNLEDLIAKRLGSSLATSVDRTLFEINVQVTVVRKADPPPVEAEKPVEPSEMAGADHLVAAKELIEYYQKSLKEVADNRETDSGLGSHYNIKGVRVVVGLSEDLDKEFTAKVKVWVSEFLQRDLGKRVQVTVQSIKSRAKPVVEPPVKENEILKFITGAQILLGLLIFSMVFFLAVYFWQNRHARDEEENRKLQIQLSQNNSKAVPTKQLEVKPNKSPDLFDETSKNMNLSLESKSIEEIIGKIALISAGISEQLDKIVGVWFETGEKGLFKVACLIDAVNIFNGLQIRDRGPQINWRVTIPSEHRNIMQTIFKRMSTMPINVKRRVFDEIYWDLAGIQYLGPEAMNAPFDFLESGVPENLEKVLEEQGPTMKTLAVLHMPPELQQKLVVDMEQSSKKALITEALAMDRIPLVEIEQLSQRLKVGMNQNKAAGSSVSMRPLAIKLLESLDPLEEMEILKDVGSSNVEKAIRRSFPSLVFIMEWPEEKLRLLLQRATSDEIIALLRLRPEWQERFMPLCKPFIATICNNELVREDKTSNDLKSKSLMTLKAKMLELISNGDVVLEKIFADEPSPASVESPHAA